MENPVRGEALARLSASGYLLVRWCTDAEKVFTISGLAMNIASASMILSQFGFRIVSRWERLDAHWLAARFVHVSNFTSAKAA